MAQANCERGRVIAVSAWRILFMRFALLAFAALLLTGSSAIDAHAQTSVSASQTSVNVYGPYSVYGPGLTYRPLPSLRLQTSVHVPDGGESLVGRYSSVSEGRNEFGSPVIGKVPGLNRATINVGSGRNVRNSSVSVRVRVIRMAEEEERQTGVRP
jgi:hypothetical protein